MTNDRSTRGIHRSNRGLAAWLLLSAFVTQSGLLCRAAADDHGVVVVTDDPKADAVESLRTLFRNRVRIVDVSTHPLDRAAIEGNRIVSILVHRENTARLNPATLASAASQGATVVMGLDEYAAWIDAAVSETAMENRQHVQMDLQDARAIAAYGRAWEDYLRGKKIDSHALAIRESMREEVLEPIPSLEIVGDDSALRGFPAGSVVPWCSGGDVYRQQQLQTPRLPEGARVLARSTMNARPMIVCHRVGKGQVYALPLQLLPEPCRRNWETRGGFNKWVPVSNLFGRGILGGSYWTSKPTYESYCRRLRETAARCPDWKMEEIGRYRLEGTELEKIYSFRLGQPDRKMWVILGMVHAEDEWVPALGALDFIRYLQDHKGDPAIARFLDGNSVRAIPLLHPSVCESPRYPPGSPRPVDELTLDVTSGDQVYAAMQLHQGGESIVTGCGTSRGMGLAIGRTVQEIAAGRSVLWRDLAWKGQPGRLAPMQPEDWVLEGGVIGGPVPEWDGYWVQGKTSCYGIYRLEPMMRAKAIHFLEQPMMGFMPDALTSAPSHHWIHRSVFEAPGYMTLWENDQTVAYCLAFLLTPISPELERPDAWKPFARESSPGRDKPEGPWTRDELRRFMKELASYVVEHHVRRDDSPMRGKVYEFYLPKTGQQGYGAGWDTMHDGAWFANACILAYRAAGDREYREIVERWVLPFYLKMLNHSDALFPDRERAFSDGQLLPAERAAAGKGFVPYWWDDGHGVNFDAIALGKTIDELLGPKLGYTLSVSDRQARDGRLAGYSHGTSNHMALALFPMLANGWLLTRQPEVAEAIHHLRANRIQQMNMDLPFLAIADFASHGDSKRAYELAAGYDRLPSPPDTPLHRAMVQRQKTSLTPFLDDPAGKYYALMIGRRLGPKGAKWLARMTYDCLLLQDQWYGAKKRPRGLACAADSRKRVWIEEGKFSSLAGEEPDVLVGSRMGPQSLWASALSLQLLRAFPQAWQQEGEPRPGSFASMPEPTAAQVQARLQEELDEGLRFWQDQKKSVGYIRPDWPIGGKRPDRAYWSDQASETGGYAHLISACAEYLMLLDGKCDWELAWSPKL